jgi:redox-sensitive bicupin YhaK (pirin superfamily)
VIQVRRGGQRGHARHGWLESYHSFSFADYFDPAHMGFGALRVINEDRVAPGQGFPTHGHRDMEIISYVLEGALEHQDSIGNGSVIRPGDVQRMSAGTGIRHSEFNASPTEAVHFLQIWVTPEQTGLAPGYEQKRFEPSALDGRLRLIGSRDGREGSVTIHQDARLYAGRLNGEAVEFPTDRARRYWLQVVRGMVTLNGQRLAAGDGAGITGEHALQIDGESAELLLFDLA